MHTPHQDGLALYRCVLWGLLECNLPSPCNVAETKREILNYIRDNPEVFAHYWEDEIYTCLKTHPEKDIHTIRRQVAENYVEQMKPKEERGGTPEIHAASLKYNLRIIEYTIEEAGSNDIQAATHGSGVHVVHLCARMGRVYDALLMSQDAPRTQAEVDKMETRRVMRDARNTNQAIPRPKPTIPVAPHETRLSSLNALQAVTNLKLSPATLRERMIEAHKDLQNPQGLQWHRNQEI